MFYGLDVLLAVCIVLGIIGVAAGYVFLRYKAYKLGGALRAPPEGWKEYLEQARDIGAGLPPFGDKAGIIRRQLILASPNISVFTNLLPLSVSKVPKSGLGVKYDSRGNQVNRRTIFGFFHPHANSGGGGERVLWAAVRQTLLNDENNLCAIYVGADEGMIPRGILNNVKERFGISFDENRVVFIFLTRRKLVEASYWPRFTLLGQSIGSVMLAKDAINILVPDVWVDTVGYSFTYPYIQWVLNIPVCAYVHYPFVSKDMLGIVSSFSLKGIYWRLMMALYSYSGSYASVVATNSTWTQQHIQSLWKWGVKEDHIRVVYPPCATTEFEPPTESQPRSPTAVYVAQFRPEKRHDLLLNEFAKFLKQYEAGEKKLGSKPHLILLGSVRNDEDKQRVYSLRLLARELDLTDDYLTFVLDAPWTNVKAILQSSSVGVNAMWNEHFGMGVVEYMAAGLIPVSHASAGPKLDIIKDEEGRPGFLFKSSTDPDYNATIDAQEDTLAQALEKAFGLDKATEISYRQRAYKAAQRFSEEEFASAWNTRVDILNKLANIRHRNRLMRGKFD